MENYEIQHFLDILLPCSDKQKRSKTANSKLDAKQEGKLYSIARRLCFESSLLRKNSGRFLVALKDIIRILNSIKYNQNMTKTFRKDSDGNIIYDHTGKNPTTVTSGYTNMPLFVKQVLYLLSVRAMQCEIPNLFQIDILEDIQNPPNAKKIHINHNFLSDQLGEITPNKYHRCINYHQPKNPLRYMGQKKGRLGTAIKHLVMQADISFTYDAFIDVFGGSSSATVAPVQKKRVTYIYNDLDPILTNYVKVVASSTLHKKFINDLKEIQTIIASGGQKYADYINNRIPRDIEGYINKPINKKYITSNVIQRMEQIKEFGMCELGFHPEEIKRFLDDFQKIIVPKVTSQDLSEPFDVNMTGETKYYTLQEIKEFSHVGDYLLHYSVIRFLMGKYKGFIKEPYSQDAKKGLFSIEKEFRQFRALGLLIFCKDLYYNCYMKNYWKPKDREERIEAASVLLILHYFSVNVETGSDSSVTVDMSKKGKKNCFDRFCEEDFEKLIEDYHKSLSRLKQKNIVNLSCIKLIKEYEELFGKNKNEDKDIKKLFYVDSPYVETTAYKVNEKPWRIEEMQELIDALFDSKQKFIFSMRACKETKGGKPTERVKQTNKAILKVFSYFSLQAEKREQELYVLAVDFDMDELEECIKKCRQCEIMLTNYPISNFYDIGWKESQKGGMKAIKIDSEFINTKEYKVKKFDEFFEIAERALQSTIS